jgi:hypothetical protein
MKTSQKWKILFEDSHVTVVANFFEGWGAQNHPGVLKFYG